MTNLEICLSIFAFFVAVFVGSSFGVWFGSWLHLHTSLKKNNLDAHFYMMISHMSFDDIARIKQRIRGRDKTK